MRSVIANKAEATRMDQITDCLPCLLSQQERQATIQHVTEGGRRLGHLYTYGSCPWHHQGIKEHGYSTQQMSGLLGPSFAHGRKAFEERYGDERDVLVKLQSWCLDRIDIEYHELLSEWHHLRRVN